MTDAQAALASANSALETVAAAVAEKDAILAELSVERDTLSTAVLSLEAQLDAANATIAELKAKVPPPPFPVNDVRTYGAVGNGTIDDTLAFQNAVDRITDAGMPVLVPEGNWLIDPVKSVLLRTGTKLQLDPKAVLVAKPNAQEKTNVLWAKGVTDVVIEGGQILGDRLGHTYTNYSTTTTPSTHEWGDGIRLTGVKRVAIRNMQISRCAGDGVTINGEDIVLENVASTMNRRQGLTIGGVKRVRVTGCTFSQTGDLGDNLGAKPKAGIDMEPDSTGVDDVVIENCTITDNDSAGFLAWIRSEVRINMTNIVLRGCNISGNVNGSWTKGLGGTIGITYEGCTFGPGGGNAIKVDQNTKAVLNGNTFVGWTSRNAVALLNGGTMTVTGASRYA